VKALNEEMIRTLDLAWRTGDVCWCHIMAARILSLAGVLFRLDAYINLK
jgi:hypothetical protein